MRLRPVLLVLATLIATPAFAQGIDVSGGFHFMREDSLEENFPGWFVQAGGDLAPMFGIVGEVTGGTKTYSVIGTDIDLSVYSFMAGPRFSGPRTASVIPFAQVLFGVVRGSVSVLGESEAENEFGFQPAGGVDVMFSPRAGVRGTGFYRRVGTDDGGNEFGFQIGIVLRSGN